MTRTKDLASVDLDLYWRSRSVQVVTITMSATGLGKHAVQMEQDHKIYENGTLCNNRDSL